MDRHPRFIIKIFPQAHPLTFSYTKQRGAVWLSPPGSRPAGIAGRTSEIADSTCSLLFRQAPRSSTRGERDTHPNELEGVWFCSRARQTHRLPGKVSCARAIPSHFRVEGSPRLVPMDRHRRPPMEMVVGVFGTGHHPTKCPRCSTGSTGGQIEVESQCPRCRPEIDN